MIVLAIVLAVMVGVVVGVLLASIQNIGATEVGLVRKRFGRKLPEDSPVAFKGEAGHQQLGCVDGTISTSEVGLR